MASSKTVLLSNLDEISKSAVAINKLQQQLVDSEDVTVIIGRHSSSVGIASLGAKFYWDISDPRTAAACLAVSGEYEPIETKILTIASEQAKYVVDVGANVGYYAVILPIRNPSIEKLYAFEPMPIANAQLTANIKMNNLDSRVDTHNFGISNSNETIKFYLPEVFGTSATSSALLHPEVPNKEIHVKVTTLDSLRTNGQIMGCDLLKIDVEGAEKFVIEGALDLISTESPVIFAELLRKWSDVHGYHPNEVVRILSEIGYSCWGVSESMPHITEINNETTETNFIFLTKNKKHEYIKSKLNLLK